ncbi:hypothetical protein ACFLFF_04210 [Brevibacillus reuszeri]|uniref:hypothetical protein n=1 Tax=Brevibacillus reuszeri TaxID=54915 RepID=UPI00366AFDB5
MRYGSWYYYYDLGVIEGKRKKIERKAVRAETKAQAQQILRRALAEYENTGTIFEPSTTSLYDYMMLWLNEYGMIKLKSLTPELLQKFINDKYREGYSRTTLTIFHTVLQHAPKQAVYPYKLINENFMQYVKLPKNENKKTIEASTHATLLLEQGAPIKHIQARLGHSRSGITLNTYSHLTDKMKNQTVDMFEKLMNDMK